jgi:ABC-type transport system substrate-binding protein
MADPGDPNYLAEFASLLAAVTVDDNRVDMDLSRPHVRPDALLQVPPPPGEPGANAPDQAESGPPRFTLTDAQPNRRVFAAVAQSDNVSRAGFPVVVELTMPDDELAVAALIAGNIDVLDRLPPWQVDRLRATSGVRVGTYRLPTVHVLVPNPKRPLLATREFRRALCYGLQREWIVQRVLLGGTSRPGFDVLSGPFPAGVSLSDPIRYAYNSQLTPRPFEPRLAAILATVGWSHVAGRAGDESAVLAQIPELVLAHPADPVARLACQSIQSQLARLGIQVKLREYEDDDLLAGRVDCDLRYAELAMWEPVVDARRLLGADGLAGSGASSYLLAALRQLDDATNWRDVRARLSEIHEIASHDLPVIPLWQTVNYFAYRTSVAGIGDSPVTLYQNVDHWDLSGTGGRAVAGEQ